MPNLTSQLAVKLIDGVSGPARNAAKSIKEIGRSARSVDGARVATNRLSSAANAVVARAAGIGAGVIGVGALANTAKAAVLNYAELERKMLRVGITADASNKDIAAATGQLRALSQIPGMPAMDKLVEGVDVLVQQGKSLPEAMASIRAIGQTAAASGAEVNDIAATAGSVSSALGIMATRMQSAFDIMVAGGKAGKFELKDMARYLPSLAPAAAAVGLKGEEGLRSLVAYVQVVRNMTGNTEEAASSMNNIFAKMESDETVKRFSKFGIDLRKEMANARKEGKPLLDVFTALADKAVKGDLSKLPQLFQDMEFARGMRALLSQKGAVDQLRASLAKVDGSTLTDFGRIADDTTSKIDRMKSSWDSFLNRLGAKLAPNAEGLIAVATDALDPMGVNGTGVSKNARIVDPDKGHAIDFHSQASARGGEAIRRNQVRGASNSMATARQREIADPNPAGGGFWNSGTTRAQASVRNYRITQNLQGKLTEGQSIERENALQLAIQQTAAAYARWKSLPRSDEQKARGEQEFTKQITAMVTEFMTLERSRNDQAMVSPEMLGKIVEGVKALATPELGTAGSEAMKSFGDGITSQSQAVETAAQGVMDRVKQIMSQPITPNIQLPAMTVPLHGRGGSPAIIPSQPIGKQSSDGGARGGAVSYSPSYAFHVHGQKDPEQFASAVHDRANADARKALRGVLSDVGTEFG
ncbi:MAG: phage tail tape measure protein [Alsobacter sp.]